MTISSISSASFAHQAPHFARVSRTHAEPRVSEEDRQRWQAVPWNPEQRHPVLLEACPDGTVRLGDVRWGFQESPDPSAWKPVYTEAVVDPRKVKDVWLAVEPFAPKIVAGHSLVLFEFEQDSPVRNSRGETDPALVVSAEALRPPGTSYDLLKGMGKNFGVVYQVGTLADQLQKVSRQQGHDLLLHRLALSPEQKESLLRNALDQSTRDRTGEWYHTLLNSCFTAQVELLNSVVPEEQKIRRFTTLGRFLRPEACLPNSTGALLARKDLLDGRVVVVRPDQKLHPTAARGQSDLQKAVARATRSPLWDPGMRVGGLLAGAWAGSAVAGLPGLVAGALTGQFLGGLAGDVVRLQTDVVEIPVETLYQFTPSLGTASAPREAEPAFSPSLEPGFAAARP